MAWQGIEGHDEVAARFVAAFERGRIAGTYLFIGPEGVGKRGFALALAKALVCLAPRPGLLPCGACASCIQAAAGSHPDIDVVDAYEIQLINIRQRIDGGAAVVGHKVGLTSKAMQASSQIDIPIVIGGREIRTGNTANAVMPHDHAHVLGGPARGLGLSGEAQQGKASHGKGVCKNRHETVSLISSGHRAARPWQCQGGCYNSS